MNVQLTLAAQEEIAVLRASRYRGAGFLLGATFGRFVLLEQLLPLDFDPRRGGDDAYAIVFKTYGQRLQGVFFCRKPPFALDWFIGDLVMSVRPGQVELHTCEFAAGERGERRARLVPLLEDKEGAWRI
jgi:hypothetical protein